MIRTLSIAPLVAALLVGCESSPQPKQEQEAMPTEGKIMKTSDEWRSQLTEEQYHVTREKGTERAFTGKYWNHKGKGAYHCVCCGQALFDSETKFESGTGWPSFWQPIRPENVGTESDKTLGMVRNEIVCSRCDAHLGHVFDDGPPPTGMRYCINSAALTFEATAAPAQTDQDGVKATSGDGE